MDNCYPKFLYHETEKPVVVQSREEHEAMGKGWKESPADFGVVTAPNPDEEAKKHPGSYRDHMEKWDAKHEGKKVAEESVSEEAPAQSADSAEHAPVAEAPKPEKKSKKKGK